MDRDTITKKNSKKVVSEFFALTNIIPLHPTNKLEDAVIRKDIIFEPLAEKVFDNPRLLDLLIIKIRHWLELAKDESTYSLAGYIYYLKEDFRKAERYFLGAINKNPKNLDNWLDLAFSLYHQDDKKYALAKKILFNFDYCIGFFNKRNNKKINLKNLEIAFKCLK